MLNSSPFIIFVLLFVSACLYALVVRWLRSADTDHGLTPFLVAGGNVLLILALWPLAGLEAAATLFGLNLVAGAPMIAEFYMWRVDQKRRGGEF